MSIVIPQSLKGKLLELRANSVVVFIPERVDKLLNLEGTEDYHSLNYELSCWQILYLQWIPRNIMPENFAEAVQECFDLNQIAENIIEASLRKDAEIERLKEQLAELAAPVDTSEWEEDLRRLEQIVPQQSSSVSSIESFSRFFFYNSSINRFREFLQEKRAAQTRVQILVRDVEMLREKRQEQENRITTLQQEISSSRNLLNDNRQELSRVQSQHRAEVMRELKIKTNELNQTRVELNTLTQTIERTEAELQEVANDLNLELNKVHQLVQQKNNLEQEKTELEQQLTAKTNELNSELTKTRQLEQDLTNLQQTKNQTETNLRQQLKAKETELQKTLTESRESTAGLRKEIEELKAELQESREVSKRELAEEQEKLRKVQENIEKQAEANTRQERLTIGELETKLANSEKVLVETRKTLSQSQTKIAELETKLLNHEQLKGRYEQRITEQEKALTKAQAKTEKLRTIAQENINLAKQKVKDLEKQLISLAWQKISIGKQLAQTHEQLAQAQVKIQEKQEQLKKTRLEVVSLQAQLKNKPNPDPKKAQTPSKPLDPWILGIVLAVAVGMLWMLNRPKLTPAQELAQKKNYGN